jgi:hypothetical protein
MNGLTRTGRSACATKTGRHKQIGPHLTLDIVVTFMVNSCMREYAKSLPSTPLGALCDMASHPLSLPCTPIPQKFSTFGMPIPKMHSGYKHRISNRLANRQSDSIRIAPKPFRFSGESSSNRLYIAYSWASEIAGQKLPKTTRERLISRCALTCGGVRPKMPTNRGER